MWVASPSALGSGKLMYVTCGGYVGGGDYNNYICGFRPLVCLKSEVRLQDNGDGTYTIIEDSDTNVDSEITITGTSEITSLSDPVSYEINYEISIEDYTGNGTATIIYYLPYAIDTSAEGTELADGTYEENDGVYTITWEIDLGAIDEEYNDTITKNISVVFVGLDASANSMTNKVTGEVELEGGYTYETAYATFDTSINIEEIVDGDLVDDTTAEDDITTQNPTNDDEIVEEVTETESETTSNPTTGDTIAVFITIFAVAIVGLVTTLVIRKRIK